MIKMKKLSTIIMALALVLGMSQCKKQETPTTGNTTPTNPGVHITVNVGDQDGKDNNGEKHNIAPDYGMFAFTQGDVLYVGHNGKYVGSLTFNGACFDGTIHPDQNVTDQPLHFYFVGNAAVTGTLTEGQTTSLSISIADQSANLPVLSYGPSEQDYSVANTSYSATLKNKCALVKLSLSTPTTETVTLSGVPTVATVNFADPTNAIAATNLNDPHDITLRYVTTWNPDLRWVILLPGTDLADVVTVADGVESVMANNTYITSGLTLNNSASLPDADLVIKNSSDVFSEFTVSSTGKKVYFSKANLTWNETDGYHFHDTQFNEEHSGGSSISNFEFTTTLPAYGDVTLSNLTGLDRFTWGHIPNQSINSSYYITNNQLSAGLDPEWGKQMTGEGNDQWRTLTADEWNYLLHKRPGNRFMLVSVLIPCTYEGDPYYTTVQGLLLFPDDFDYSGLNLTQAANANKIGFWPGRINKVYVGAGNYNPASGNYTPVYDGNVNYSPHDIAAGIYKLIETAPLNSEHFYTNPSSNMYKLLEAGCVFLPAVGSRVGAEYKKYFYYGNRNNAAQGFYWASDRVISGTSENAKYFWFGYPGGGAVETNPCPTFEANNTQHRSLGCCVRLVWDAN